MKSPEARRVARLVRTRIERGDYTDGHLLVQERLAAEFGAGRSVVWRALAELRDEGFVSVVRLSGQDHYLVNATHVSRQVQRLLNSIEDQRAIDRGGSPIHRRRLQPKAA
jgi:DNA-binding GntR family transcriptional regulator